MQDTKYGQVRTSELTDTVRATSDWANTVRTSDLASRFNKIFSPVSDAETHEANPPLQVNPMASIEFKALQSKEN